MNRLIRFYNQNRKKIWKIIVILLAFLILLRFCNYLAKKNNEKIEIESEQNNNELQQDENEVLYSSSKSGVTGSEVSKTQLEKTQSILSEFYDACNNKELEKAYNMLTDECKEMLYSSLDIFQSNYYNYVFNGEKKNYNFENWNGNTYYITLKGDALTTGKVESKEEALHDYVTIVNDKLNISTYIGRTRIDKQSTRQDVKITVISKDTFMDYETYNVRITNNSNNTICLTTGQASSDVYIQDNKEVKYGVYNHELIPSKMIINSKISTSLAFKFYNSYASTKKINRLCFESFNFNYQKDGEEDIKQFNVEF